MPCWGQPTGAETAPFLPRNASPILSPSTAFWEENQPITLFQDLPHLLSLSIPLSLTSSGNLSQKALSFTQFRACSMLLRGTKLQPVLHPFLPPPTIEPFPTLLRTHFMGNKNSYLQLLDLSPLSLSFPSTLWFASVLISLLKLILQKPPIIFQLGDLITFYSIFTLVNSAAFSISVSYSLYILCCPGSQDTPLSAVLILIPWPPPPLTLHSVVRRLILGLFSSSFLKISAFTSLWVVNA